MPERSTVPWVGLRPWAPQHAAGRIRDPAVWLPKAHQYRTGIAHRRDARRIRIGPAPGIDRRSVFGRHVCGIDDVLGGERDAVQRPLALGSVGLPRLGNGEVGIEILPGLYRLLALLDAYETGADEVFRGDFVLFH